MYKQMQTVTLHTIAFNLKYDTTWYTSERRLVLAKRNHSVLTYVSDLAWILLTHISVREPWQFTSSKNLKHRKYAERMCTEICICSEVVCAVETDFENMQIIQRKLC